MKVEGKAKRVNLRSLVFRYKPTVLASSNALESIFSGRVSE